MRHHGFIKNKLSLWFLEIIYSLQGKYLGANLENICYFQGTQETQADSLSINILEGIMKEASSWTTNNSTKVASKNKGDMTFIEDKVCQEGAVSKGSAQKRFQYSMSLTSKKPKTFYVCPTALLTQKQDRDRLCYISRFLTGIQKTN